MTRVLCIHGTWGADFDHTGHQWYEPGSAFLAYLISQNCDAATLGNFTWSGDIGGTSKVWPWNWFRSRQERDWRAAAAALTYFLNPRGCPVPLEDRNIIAHSHAAQVVAFACAGGLRINRLITVSSPVRSDMNRLYEAARPQIGSWLHAYSDNDNMQWFGELADGHLGVVRKQPFADRNVLVPRMSHSKLLNDPICFPCWQKYGLIDFLVGTHAADHA